ncbi:BICD family-like cargo adapter 1 [Silurus meridionalis]|nr:BICD family-like cargo adapter 1 [Silurus meridionalis]
MSAFGLNPHTISSVAAEISAQAELDSACADCDSQNPPASRGTFTHPPPLTHLHQSLLNAGSGGLGTVLEEELTMLTREREEELVINEQDADLLALFRQKEKDLVLAAKLGKALLERNQDLTKQYEKMTKDLNEKLENLEQEKHELRQRLERREGEWEGRVAELETDVQQLKGELEKHKIQLREADRDKTRTITELSEQNHSLLERLRRAADVERQLCTQVHSLRDDFREKNISKNHHMTQLESLQAEIKILSKHKQDLERCLTTLHEENEQLQSTVDNLKERTLVLEKLCHEKDLQASDCLNYSLRQNHLELQEVRLSHRQLSVRLAEMTEERSLQGFSSNSRSLLCEIEQSMEQEELEQEREQVHTYTYTHTYIHTYIYIYIYRVARCEIEQSMEQEELEQEREQLRLQLWEAYCQIRSICSQLRGNDITDSALSTDSSMDESSETSSAKDVPMGSLQSSLLELRRLTQNLLDANESTIALLSLEVCSSREENERLRASEVQEPSEQLQNAIRDRDDAIVKKKAVEMELAKCKVDIMSLNSQLLDAIQQKFNLSQQLEAWQDDVLRLLDQQLMDKHQGEWRDSRNTFSGAKASTYGSSGATSRQASSLSNCDKRLFSFFKKN